MLCTSLIPDIRTCAFGGAPLNRLNNLRRDPDQLNQLSYACAKHIVFNSRLEVLVHSPTSSSLSLSFLTNEHHDKLSSIAEQPLFLGVDSNQVPHIAHQLSSNQLPDSPSDTRFSHLRTVFASLPSNDAVLAAHARALFAFHAGHKFCGQCGSPTLPDQAGARRRCVRNTARLEPGEKHIKSATGCDGVWFPRIDPVVIMLVIDRSGDRVLLGRQSRFPKGMYSCLAGFMEHGEGVDDAVRREVHEESGVTVGRVRFFASQPWPFPHSLMLGCMAQADNENISLDQHELEDAQWFDRAQVAKMLEHGSSKNRSIKKPDFEHGDPVKLFAPPKAAIAGEMMESFVEQQPITSFSAWSQPVGML